MILNEKIRKCIRPALALGFAGCLFGGVAAAESAPIPPEIVVTAATKALTAAESSIQPIAGTWYEADVPNARMLTIYADGKYEAVCKNGSKSFGVVMVTAEVHPDGSKSLWYSFYEEGGLNLEDEGTASPWFSVYKSAFALRAAFPKEKNAAVQTDLRSGHDGAIHFIRDPKDVYHATSKNVKAEDYLGVWAYGRCYATISRDKEGYRVELQWANSAAEGSRWIYSCTYNSYSGLMFSNNDGTRIDYVYTDDGSGTDNTVYDDGKAFFILRDGKLTWLDTKENTGDGLELRKIPQ